MPFRDRTDAGRQLARALEHLRGSDVVVLGLPRGGVPVAAEVAKWLGAPLDMVVVRKLGVPSQPELAMGAIGEGDARVVNPVVLRAARVTQEQLDAVERTERRELKTRVQRLRAGRPRVPVAGRTAVIIDDGIATGATIRVASEVVRAEGAARVVLAAPVAPPEVVTELSNFADEVVCLETPAWFSAVGQWYEDFRPVSDGEVAALLHPGSEDPRPAAEDIAVTIPAGGVQLPGQLVVPPGASGVVVFAHGSGSSRHSPRNRAVAGVLQRDGFGTLLCDLLTEAEEGDRRNVFDLPLLTERLIDVTQWLRNHRPAGAIGYFGASTGAAAALAAAASLGAEVAAVVSRGGRPDLALDYLARVTAPTLLIVGGNDIEVLRLNQVAAARLRAPHELVVIPGATHLFEEPGALASVAERASAWFSRYLV